MNYAALSHSGRVRTENHDRWSAAPEIGMYVVADGMGATAAAGRAAQIAVDALPNMIRTSRLEDHGCEDQAFSARLNQVLCTLSARIRRETKLHLGVDGAGTTIVSALVGEQCVSIGHLGDSRAYLVRQEGLLRLTKDHSVVQMLVDLGELARNDAKTHPSRRQLTRYLGMPGKGLPETVNVKFCPGDRLLLCTDGLTGMLSETAIQDIGLAEPDLRNACRCLIEAAIHAGGKDNVTVCLVDLDRGVKS